MVFGIIWSFHSTFLKCSRAPIKDDLAWMHLIYARGYRALGELQQADEELALAAPETFTNSEILKARAGLLLNWREAGRAEADWRRVVAISDTMKSPGREQTRFPMRSRSLCLSPARKRPWGPSPSRWTMWNDCLNPTNADCSNPAANQLADALLGEDVAWTGRVVFQFSAEARNEDTQVMRFMRVVWSPNFFQQKAMG